MGLFDRFKKMMKRTEDTGEIVATEDSVEAEEALHQKRKLMEEMESTKPEPEPEPAPASPEQEDEWDEQEPKEAPFSKPLDKKERKKAERKKAERKTKPPKKKPKSDPMETTTGFKLVPAETARIEVDLSESEVSRGGMIIRGGEVLDGILEELETDLLSVDMGHTAVEEVVQALKATIIGSRITTRKDLSQIVDDALRTSLRKLLEAGYWDFDKTIQSLSAEEGPVVIMVVGVNGTGKTTTTAKMAHRLTEAGYSVVLAAADTFRAGAIDQLATHAERLGVRCISSQRGGDSAAISRDAVESAAARGDDIVIIDTAGRMQNKTNLMEELRKVHRVTKPHLVLFVADALAGNDAVEQAKVFQSMLRFDGAVLCKMDTDANGGAALSIAHTTGRPIVLAGTGQGYEDLIPFDPEWLLDSIL
mgnify:CR=1 FL=1|tara:strand:- start:1754 stop:3013 length:1260 start_codon:yes stop_codon:yes gene_type:complete